METEGLISIREAAKRGLNKIRLDKWSNPDDYIEFDIIDGAPGPWFRLYSPTNALIEMPNPQRLLVTMMGDLDKADWRPLPRTLHA